MFQLYLDFIEFQSRQQLSYFVYIFIFSWIVYIIRLIPGLFYYKPKVLTDNYCRKTPMNVIIPVVDEPLEIFEEVLARIHQYVITGDSIIIVQNGPKKNLKQITQQFGFIYKHTATPSKRNAIRAGLSQAIHPTTLLVDSDSIWESNCFGFFEAEFEDPRVGGVTSLQYIPPEGKTLQAKLVNRYALMIESMRNSISFRSQSVHGQIGCLPGRTIGFRTHILTDHIDEFMNDYFMGHKIEFSDDRFLTNKTLLDGYRTVYAQNAIVRTNAPTTFSKYIKQQLRWARGSQINNIRTIPQLLKKRLWYISFLFTADTLLPFLWSSYMIGSIIRIMLDIAGSNTDLGPITLFVLTLGSIILSYLIKYGLFSDTLQGLDGNPFYVLIFASLFAGFTIFLMTPLRVYGFITMLLNLNWGTRKHGYTQQSAVTMNMAVARYIPLTVGVLYIIINIIAVLQL